MNISTEVAPAERAPEDVLQKQTASLSRQPLLTTALNTMVNSVLILNEQRQIVFCSDNFLKLLPPGEARPIGLRPGEALGCVHANETLGGCGTSAYCQNCGAVNAIMTSIKTGNGCDECRLVRQIRDDVDAVDLLVNASELEIDGWRFCLTSLADISHEKRRRALDRIFFHDVLNMAGGITQLAGMLATEVPADLGSDMELLRNGLDAVMEEILAQRDLAAAESHELVAFKSPIRVRDLLVKTVAFYKRHPVAHDRNISLLDVSPALEINTDQRLLKRVIGNLIKNALEASHDAGCVTVGCSDGLDDIELFVHNETSMPEAVQRQVFNRSFSTKGKDRGLGTYSIRLLTERYLKGTVRFTSAEDSGTTFFISLPKKI